MFIILWPGNPTSVTLMMIKGICLKIFRIYGENKSVWNEKIQRVSNGSLSCLTWCYVSRHKSEWHIGSISNFKILKSRDMWRMLQKNRFLPNNKRLNMQMRKIVTHIAIIIIIIILSILKVILSIVVLSQTFNFWNNESTWKHLKQDN